MSGPIVMPFMKKVATQPIMSFQTNLNGIFNPFFTIASGTLKWIIDDEEQITNSPSKALTGATVDVKVFANTVAEEAISTNTQFNTDGIIGSLSFAHFKLTNTFVSRTNSQNNNIIFSNFANALSTVTILLNGSLPSLDFSDVSLSGFINCQLNSILASITFKSTPQNLTQFTCDRGAITALDLSDITFSGTGNLHLFTNPMTSLTFKNTAHSIGEFRGQSTQIPSIDLSNFTITKIIFVQSNSSLITLQSPAIYATGFSQYLANNCALNETSVNEILTTLDTYFSANAPTVDLTVTITGGTNAIPGAAGLAAKAHLEDTVYPDEGKTATITVNS